MSLQARFRKPVEAPATGKWPGKLLFSVKEAAEYLDVHVNKIRTLYRTQQIKVAQTGTQGLMFSRQELDRYAAKLDRTAVVYIEAPSRRRPHKQKTKYERPHLRDFTDEEIRKLFHFESRQEMREHLAALKRDGKAVTIRFD